MSYKDALFLYLLAKFMSFFRKKFAGLFHDSDFSRTPKTAFYLASAVV